MQDFNIFNNELDTHDVTAGQTIFSEGQPGNCMYAVVEGEVEILRNGRLLEVVGAGGVFGEMALIDKLPRSASAIARADGLLARISEERFLRLVQQTPHFALQIMQVLTRRVRNNLTS